MFADSSFRPLVNGALLPQYVGKTVTIFGTVISTENNGMSFDIKSTDRQVITVSLRNAISEPVTGTVEVHGIVKGKNNIVCNYFMAVPSDISSTFDPEMVNDVVNVVHAVPNAWKAVA